MITSGLMWFVCLRDSHVYMIVLMVMCVQCNLDKDIKDLPTEANDAKDMNLEQRDLVVGKVHKATAFQIAPVAISCHKHTVWAILPALDS